jgi:hypothetical protein
VALPVSPALTLPVALHGLRVSLLVLPGIIRMAAAPFLLAVPADLTVFGVSFSFVAVIFPPALPLTGRSTADKLVGMITGKLKELLAVAAVAVAHQAAPNRDACRPL